MTREEAAHKVQNLWRLANSSPFPFEAATATQIAEAMIMRYELTRAEVKFNTRKRGPTLAVRKLRALREQIVRCKMWLVYAGHHADAGAEVAKLQAQLEQFLERWEHREKPIKQREPKVSIHQLRRKYL